MVFTGPSPAAAGTPWAVPAAPQARRGRDGKSTAGGGGRHSHSG